uniref:Uncharacterized protein n=1 Tax=Daucus carota subsp. sativus TaxID=79200 RepID=A0A166HDS4_DAUCS
MTQMSDPLTALMHAVQVMNLLKTLILKALREREETTIAGYSPMSYCSFDRHTDEEVDSQHEMNTSFEWRGPQTDHNAHKDYGAVSCPNGPYNASSESESEVGSFGEIEESSLKPMINIENTKNSVRTFKGHLKISSPEIGSTFSTASGASIFDRRIIRSSGLSISDEEDSGLSSTEAEPSKLQICQ